MKRTAKAFLVAVTLTAAVSATGAWAGEALRLKAIMNDLAADMETITRGIGLEDYSAIEEAARNVADHEKPPMSERMKILGFLGKRAAGFKQADKLVHDSSLKIAEAAEREDMDGVVENFTTVLTGCVECHDSYRADVIDHFYGGGGK